jgi:hypothetical protein
MHERFMFKDGCPMAVLRPRDPELKMKHLTKLQSYPTHQQTKEKFGRLLSEQDHQFIGWAGVDKDDASNPAILNGEGNVIEHMNVGDSFVACSRIPQGGVVMPWPDCLKRKIN